MLAKMIAHGRVHCGRIIKEIEGKRESPRGKYCNKRGAVGYRTVISE